MGIFTGVEDAKGYGSGPYFEDGVYIAQITECGSGQTRDDNVGYFTAQFDILDSTNPKLKPGLSVTWWVGFYKDTPGLANMKKFVAKATGCDEKEVTSAGCEMIVGPEQPLRGTVMRVRAKTIITKKKGEPFTVCEFEPYEGSPQMVHKLRVAAKLAVDETGALTAAAAPPAGDLPY